MDAVHRATAQCPLRPGQPCTLCHPEAHSGPQDCPTVAIPVSTSPSNAATAAATHGSLLPDGRPPAPGARGRGLLPMGRP